MGKSRLSDKDLEDLLRELPKVNDNRHPREIYRNISRNKEKRRRSLPTWLIPGVATGIVLLLIFILSPQLTGIHDTASDNSRNDSSTSIENKSTDSEYGAKKLEISEGNDQQINELTAMLVEEPSAVYPEDLNVYQAFTIAIPDPNALLTVPVTVLIEKMEEKTWFELFEEMMPKLTEEKWGLAEYFPLDVNLSYDQASETVLVDVPANHQYGHGSAAETMFTKTLQESFPNEKVKTIKFTTEGKKGIVLGNYGEIYELQTEEYQNRAYYFTYLGSNPRPYMVPSEQKFASIMEAYSAMEKDEAELGLQASIPTGIKMDFTTAEDDAQTLIIKVAEESALDNQFLYNFEAIMLTAKSFGYDKIRVEGQGIEQIGPFSLTEDVLLPVGPNKKLIQLN
ncbi:negative regulator of sigma-X activity [Mesobacillus maritimus]|uniref:Negative regulator of sigma-X activity n=1 Tax=Mesobacillus maritimus TaxID=1643336 RepID=A0ABS7K2Y5_9BACI|nr:negative regulator of sigma-X activity [Mesobacillus maritimus]MBY0096510.1 negative regulator of sigma-X activity [Mesobacillus maritimus]